MTSKIDDLTATKENKEIVNNNVDATQQQQQNDDGDETLMQDARLKEEHDRLVAKYGKTLSKQMLRKKLMTKRHFFDSADYFRKLERGEKELFEGDATPILHCFKRSKDGELQPEPAQGSAASASTSVRDVLSKSLTTRGKKHFDSADWVLKLEGLLEYPLGDKPHPVMFYFNQDRVDVVAHPSAKADAESVHDMCKAADDELRRRYGTKLSANQVMRLKLRGAAKKKFDSAEWALSLQGYEPNE